MTERRDSQGRPADVLDFFGIGPGMTVLDFQSAAGYYSEMLSLAVGPEGRVLAHNHPGAEAMLGAAVFDARYGNGRLPNVELLFSPHDDLGLASESLDIVLMVLVYHDTYWFDAGVEWGPVDRADFLAQIFAALRPGGRVGLIDHRARRGADPAETARVLHRIDEAVVLRDFATAGFELEARSELLGNPDDDLTLSVFDPAVKGNTDRFVLRFRRPE